MTRSFRVLIEETALLDLLLPVVEKACLKGFILPGGNNEKSSEPFEGIEVGGRLWGVVTQDTFERDVIVVRRASPEVTVLGDKNSIHFRESSKQLQENIMVSFSPQLKYVGDFHSHPYIHHTEKEVENQKLNKPSPTDNKTFRGSSTAPLHLIVTISRVSNIDKLVLDIPSYGEAAGIDFSCLRFRLNDVMIWLRAIITESDDGDTHLRTKSVELICPRVLGMGMLPIEMSNDPNLSFLSLE